MRPKCLAILTVTAVVGAVGCGGGVGGVVPPGPSISGLMSDTRGGPAVSGATVLIEGAGLSTTTDSSGAFAFSGVSAGTYNLLATLAGYGASRLQGVVVSGGVTTPVRMLMRRAFDPAKSIVAPTIAISGLAPGATVSGSMMFTINVTSANPMRLIQVRFGQRGDGGLEFEDSASATVTWNTQLNANGVSFANVIAYDNNYNVAEWSIPVTVSNAASGSVAPPSATTATAITLGRPVNLFLAQREAMARAGRLRGNPSRLALRQGRFVDIQAAPADSTLLVYVLWSQVPGASGYKVYKSFSIAGPFALLADAGAGVSAACSGPCYRDSSPDLAVGTTVYYTVSAYVTAYESPQTAPVETTPLPAFNLNLSSPIDETTGIPPGGIGTQTFSYAPTAVIGTMRHYEGRVAGVNDPISAWWFFCVDNITTITYGTGTCSGTPAAVALQRAKRYEWDITYAYAYATYSTGDAYSMAGFSNPGPPFIPLQSSGSLNGPFRFTTAP